jgi:hypothetical protein
MKVERIRDNDYIIHYPSFQDLTSDKAKTPENDRLDAAYCYNNTANANWYGAGCKEAKEFVRLAGEGWPELVSAVQRKAAELVFNPDVMPVAITQAMKRKRIRSDRGNELDIHRVYQGRSDVAWSDTRRELQNVRRRAVHLYVNIGGLAMEDAVASQWRAAAAYRVCELFQRSGYSVEITVGASASGVFPDKSYMTHTSFTAKSSAMPMNLNMLALQATLGWHRVFNFHARCCNDRGYRVSGSMGSTVQMPSPFLKDPQFAGALVLTIPANTYGRDMAMGVVRLAQKTLEEAAK